VKHAAATVAIAMAAMTAFAPRLALAQSPATSPETRSVPFGDTAIVLYAPSQHCLLDTGQAADEQLTEIFFRWRQGKVNTYLGAFLDCGTLITIRSKKQPPLLSSYAYYLAFTATANNPISVPRDRRGWCNDIRAREGSFDLSDARTMREIDARMEALPLGKPWFGPVVAEDELGCYQIILYKRPVAKPEAYREALLTVNTWVKGRQVTYTRAVPYDIARLPRFVEMVQSEVAAFVAANSRS
jgi:hypothetical protein